MTTSSEDQIRPSNPSELPTEPSLGPSCGPGAAAGEHCVQPLIPKEEWFVIWALFALMGIGRVMAAWHYRIDSDETQHMHVVWGWTRGLLQYRDIFDNHAPLFQMTMAPFMALLPEQPQTLIWLRVAMLPFFAVALWATYLLGKALYSQRAGVWAAIFTGFMPGFFLCSAEFRTDNLWTDFWLLGLAAFAIGRMTTARSFFTGLLLGAAVAASMKTMLLLSCLAGGVLLVGIYGLLARKRIPLRQSLVNIAAGLGGFVIFPALIIGYFAQNGALAAMYNGVLKHNLIMHRSATGRDQWFLPICAGLAIAGWFYYLKSPAAVRGRRALVVLAGAIYIAAIFTLWPLLEREHYLPFYPLVVLFLTSPVLRLASAVGKASPWRLPRFLAPALILPLAVAIYEAHVIDDFGKLRHNRTLSDLKLVKSTLELTGPNQTVIDLKGETVFRRRASYYVFEPIARTGIRMKLLTDDTIPEAIKTGTRVAAPDSKNFPDKTRQFLNENYLSVGILRVLGKHIPASEAGAAAGFEIIVPEKYTIVNVLDGAPVTGGELDGTPYTGARVLEAGKHQFTEPAGAPEVAVLLADAVALGYKPAAPKVEKPSRNETEDKQASKLQRGLWKLIQ